MERIMDITDIPAHVKDLLRSLEVSEQQVFEDEASIGDSKVIIRRGLPKNSQLAHRINTIPWGTPGSCHETLLVAIGSNPSENVEFRVLQAVEHVWAICRDDCKFVIFWAAKWDAVVWKRHARSFRSVTPILKHFEAAPTMLS